MPTAGFAVSTGTAYEAARDSCSHEGIAVLLGEAMIQVRGSTAVSVTSPGHGLAVVGGTDVGPPGRNPYERKQRSFVVNPELLKVACSSFFALGAG